MLLRRYAQILGVVLILVGLLGLLLGERVWLGVLNVDLFEDIVHLVTGGLLAFVGFSERGGEYARSVVGGAGGDPPALRPVRLSRTDPVRAPAPRLQRLR